jgi:hypothetical protein
LPCLQRLEWVVKAEARRRRKTGDNSRRRRQAGAFSPPLQEFRVTDIATKDAHLVLSWCGTGLGSGTVFAWAYVSQRSFALACVLQAIGGLIIFTSGLGIYFYHGAIGTV